VTELSAPWDGTSTGDASAAPYDAGTEWALLDDALNGAYALAGRGGVVRDALNELGCTVGAAKVTIATGVAFAYGTKYINDAPLDIAITTPAVGGTRIDRIVLRKDWMAQTVRLTKIVGTAGAGVPALGAGTPAYTQTAGTTWDVPLFQVSTTTGGAITVSADERVYLPVHGDQSSESGTKHAYGNISGAPAASGTVTTVVPGAAGTAGVSTNYSAGDHQHPLAADKWVAASDTPIAGTGGLNDPTLTLALPSAGTYAVHLIASFQLIGATSMSYQINFSGGAFTNGLWSITNFDPTVGGGIYLTGFVNVYAPGNLYLSFAASGIGSVAREPFAFFTAHLLY
jgi:hypothetical protein